MNSNVLIFIAAVVIAMVAWKFSRGGTNMETKNEVVAKLKAGALALDVRTPGEFASGHYPQALNIPLNELPNRLGELTDKQRAIVVYCLSGGRSSSARQILLQAGFTDVTNGGGLKDMPQS